MREGDSTKMNGGPPLAVPTSGVPIPRKVNTSLELVGMKVKDSAIQARNPCDGFVTVAVVCVSVLGHVPVVGQRLTSRRCVVAPEKLTCCAAAQLNVTEVGTPTSSPLRV